MKARVPTTALIVISYYNEAGEALAKELCEVMDPEFPFYIPDSFKRECIDEAHIIKNNESTTHVTLAWLYVNFVLLVTASRHRESERGRSFHIHLVNAPTQRTYLTKQRASGT